MALFANGTQLALNSTTVSEVLSISAPNYSSDTLDSTTHDSSDHFRTFVKGLTDAGEITLDILYDETQYNTLVSLQETTSQYSSSIVAPSTPSASKWESNVYVTGLEANFPHDGLAEGSITLKVSGKPTFSLV